MKLRKATVLDIKDLLRILSQARVAQRLAGFRQWEDGYPSTDILKKDIDSAIGYVLDDDGRSAGYVAIAMGDDEYDRHPELWDAETPYAVFHRIALSDDYRGKGISAQLFDLAESLSRQMGAESVRIDTGLKNRPMRHILSQRGYTNRGDCTFIWGKRTAYEKPLK